MQKPNWLECSIDELAIQFIETGEARFETDSKKQEIELRNAENAIRAIGNWRFGVNQFEAAIDKVAL